MAAKMSLLAFMIFSFHLAPRAYAERQGFRATMIRCTDTTASFKQAARQSHHRLSMLSSRLDKASSHANAETPLRMEGGGGAYDMELSIGTPPQKLTALADTGSDLIWTKCGPCASCTPQGSPSYYPNMSSTFSKLPCSDRLCAALQSESSAANCSDGGPECDCRYSYGVERDLHHYTQGFLGSETLALAEDDYGRSSGLVGLGRGQLSLVSQLNAGTFSYCLTSNASKASPLLFGSLANLTGSGVQSTRLLPYRYSIFYAVNLQNISIVSATTPGPGADGVVFDSGTTVTFLAEPAYTLAKAAVLPQVNLTRAADRDGFEACYENPGNGSVMEEAVPSMVLNFDGADMVSRWRTTSLTWTTA
ncbi:unnamed protein product [Miscanthus lutarioriparius]|uniref:Peptidase A1 domain-containing protein n=1 Tax=Miscanthus lutarioriparius TaxID=422564 RepID=A0A811Q9R2_9POAL|nr:unnamed protein product [Miscanthus lutarioriparius]